MDIEKAQLADLVADIVRKVSRQIEPNEPVAAPRPATYNGSSTSNISSTSQISGSHGVFVNGSRTAPVSSSFSAPSSTTVASSRPRPRPAEHRGYESLDDMIASTRLAQQQWVQLSQEQRDFCLQSMRAIVMRHAQELADMAVRDTRMGIAGDKLIKIQASAQRTPAFESISAAAFSNAMGLNVNERYPYGVIASFVPCTDPVATVVQNAICMVSAGNGVVFHPHRRARQCCRQIVAWLTDAIVQAGGPRELLTIVEEPSEDSAAELMHHPDIDCVVMQGGEKSSRASLSAGRKCIVAGPGNPPCVIDSNIDIAKAAQSLVTGSSFDCNLLSCSEKLAIIVEDVYREFVDELLKRECIMLNTVQAEDLTRAIFLPPPVGQSQLTVNEDLRGLRPGDIARAIGFEIPVETRLLLIEAHPDHPLVHNEQLMPVMPLVRVRNLDEAIELAIRAENHRGHTVVMHSHNNAAAARLARRSNCAIFVQNGTSIAALGLCDCGPAVSTVATATGEGIVSPQTYMRQGRRVLADTLSGQY